MADGPLAGLLARAVVVIGKDGKVAYTELVPEITQEPDYEKGIGCCEIIFFLNGFKEQKVRVHSGGESTDFFIWV